MTVDVSDLTHYVFQSIWHVRAPLTDLITVLGDLESYPAWWPEIQEVRPLGGKRFEVVARSLLPYALRFVSEADVPQSSPHVIDARLSGDMEGTVRWTVTEADDRCRLVYDQEVTTHKRLLNVMAPVARPGFKANHALMMRHGQAGLRTFMAGYTRGTASVKAT
ncbi:MAG: SRPBCC family protein [Actinobacteria bacterium]|nr:SRPBCC family protein [Actinomycetota bacterium]